ncbi:helix-turn-helix domain-containing protein [Aquimarina sp. ERC-38]|uniref:helix-turn-helix domain-containing protein n=1 Tax=Aquimarina sp. ERC-38 TaxID=2949996 RepID=UPI002248519D|nr:helix-turn-helix transcriptional regulator [Aquimarina sp. ERC-38]UZO80657.1 helix-turn-helix domain-containing protein [Aquimarina sp. ERC-38]UZO80671.1 helix-turn-helix domain-containing protein [Aquimarina sp. ERC-38]
MTLGERIQKHRKELGITQSELARKINISHTQMARYEIKDVQPPANILKKLADLFGTSIDYLVCGTANEKIVSDIQDASIINEFKKIASLPSEEKKTLLKVISAYLRDFQAKKAYAS